jgi:hypothetical protein
MVSINLKLFLEGCTLLIFGIFFLPNSLFGQCSDWSFIKRGYVLQEQLDSSKKEIKLIKKNSYHIEKDTFQLESHKKDKNNHKITLRCYFSDWNHIIKEVHFYFEDTNLILVMFNNQNEFHRELFFKDSNLVSSAWGPHDIRNVISEEQSEIDLPLEPREIFIVSQQIKNNLIISTRKKKKTKRNKK